MPGDTLGGFFMSGLGLLLLDATPPAWANDVSGPRDGGDNAFAYQAVSASASDSSSPGAPVWSAASQSYPGTISSGANPDSQAAQDAAPAPGLEDDGLGRLLNFWKGFAPERTSPARPDSSDSGAGHRGGGGGPTHLGPSSNAAPAPVSIPGSAAGAGVTPLRLAPALSPPPPPPGGSGGSDMGWSGGSFSLGWTAPSFTPNPTITRPQDQTSAEGAAVSLAIVASDPNHYSLAYDCPPSRKSCRF